MVEASIQSVKYSSGNLVLHLKACRHSMVRLTSDLAYERNSSSSTMAEGDVRLWQTIRSHEVRMRKQREFQCHDDEERTVHEGKAKLFGGDEKS
jgi:hypothetical protein